MTGRAHAAALALALALAGAVAAGAVPRLVIEAPPELRSEAERLRRLPAGALEQPARLVGEGSEDPITVSLMPEGASAARAAQGWVAGYAYGALSRIVLFPERVPHYPDSTLEELLLHEVAHVLIDRAAGHRSVPRWFHEGVASVAGGAWDLRDGSRLTLAMLSSRELTPRELDRLFGDPAKVGRAYAVADAFVRDLMRRHGETVVPEILARVRQGASFAAAFRTTVGLSPEQAAHEFWGDEVFWYRWVPVLTSSATLWIAITLLALVAIGRRRQRDAAMAARWDAEEEALRRRLAAALEPREPPPS
ncbi:MAG: hypothetical protein R2991_00670 [Thermoanaerobaculia bacterium]